MGNSIPNFLFKTQAQTEQINIGTTITNNILSGGEIALFKVWLCGLPASLLTDMHKKR